MADIQTLTKEKVKLDEPGLYDVIFLNDGITTMEFVIRVLKQIFNKNQEQAENITKKIHKMDKELLDHMFTKLQNKKVSKQHFLLDKKTFHYKLK